MIDIPYFLE